MKRVAWGVSVCVAIVALILAGCGGSSSVSITFLGGTALAIDQGQQVVINVTLTNDANNQGVTWTCSGAACTNLTTTTTSATFMANGATGTAMITATSVKDPSSSKSVTVTVTASPSTTTTQAQLTAAPATVGQSYSFTLTASGGAGALTWTATGLPANGLSINSSTGAITGTPTTQGTITFTYTVKDSSAAGVESSTSGSLTITINPAPVLSITKTHTGSFTQGQQGATYTVTVSNAAGAGPTVGTTVTVTDTVPSGETLVSMAGSGWTCKSGGTTCTRSDVLAAGASYPAIAVTVNVGASASSPQTNNVSVSGGGSATANGSDPTTIVEPVLTISKSHTGNFNVGQQNATYSVTVGNNGSAPTSGTVTVTETVPTGETLVSMAGTGWTCASGATTCTRSDALAVASSYPSITVTVNVAANATSPQNNKASVSGGGSVSANASDPTTILYPVLKTTKSHTGNFNLGQQNATYTVTVGNTGTGAAAPTAGTVTMTETVPPGETLVSMTGTGWTCGVPNPANVCTRNDALAVGSSYPAITVTVNVSATASTPQTNQVSASGGGAAAAATASDPTTILYPVLNITKSHTGNFTQGQTGATYTVTVSNNGSAPTVGTVTMTETVPNPGETLVAMTGVGWVCGAPTNAANVCTRGDALAVASSYPSITVTVNVASNATTPQTNQVSASGGGATASATATDPTTIVEPVLGITKSHSGNFTIGQAGASYAVTVSNSGTASTSGIVTVTDTLPSGESLVSISGTGWTCGVPNPANVCTRSDALATASSYPTITVTVNVAADATSPQNNKASVSGGGSVSANASDPTTIVEPTLSITKSHTGNFVQGQTDATYTVTVSNTGTASTSGAVEVTETVPAGESFVSMAGTGWTCPGTGGATTCDRSDALANGSSYPAIAVTVNVSGTAASPQINQVSVSGGGAPPTASESTTDSTVINQVSVTFSSGQFSTIAAGAAGVTVTASVANDTGSKGVTWTLTAGGSACAPTCGTLSGATTTTVVYTPPATIPSSPDNTPTITATSVADTGQSASFNFTIGSADPCASAGTGGESLLSGSYAFLLKGLDNGTGSGETGPEPALVGGVLTLNGSGTISAGVIDMNLNSTAGVSSHSVTSGTYKIGTSGSADQQRVCMSITTSAGTQHYRASINSSGTIAHMIGFDSAGPFVTGEMKKQSSTIPTTVSGNFAFGVSSAQNTASCNNSVCGGKFGAVGILDFTSGGSVTGGDVDFNADGGLDSASGCVDFSSCGPISIMNGGSYSISANGRGTLTFTPSGSNAVTAVMYVVSSTDALILGSQDQTSQSAFAGEAIKQSGSLALSGNYVGAVTRLGSTAGDSRADLLRGNFSSGNITNFTQYKNDSGTVSVQSGGSGTYTISGTGRMLPNVGGAGPVLYLVSSSEAFFLGQSTAVDSGFFQSQTSTASPSTTNAFGTIDPATSNVNEQDGLAAFSSPNVNVTQDQNSLNGGQQAGKTQSQTFSVDGTGFGAIPSGCTPATQGSCQFVFYVITSTSAVGTDFGGSDPAVQPLDH